MLVPARRVVPGSLILMAPIKSPLFGVDNPHGGPDPPKHDP